MLKLHDTVMYGTTGVCTVQKVEEKKIGKVLRKYYVLKPMAQSTSTVFVPADNEGLLYKVRPVLTVSEINEMVASLAVQPDCWVENDADRKAYFTEIVSSGDRLKSLCMIKSISNRQKELSQKGKRLHIVDERIYREAIRLINDEFSYVLKINADEVQAFINQSMK